MALTIAPSPFGTLSVTVKDTPGTMTVSTVATAPAVLTMQLGVPGPAGANGSPGSPGQGIATGGLTGQSLVKTSNSDYATGWSSMLPLSGGTMAYNSTVTILTTPDVGDQGYKTIFDSNGLHAIFYSSGGTEDTFRTNYTAYGITNTQFDNPDPDYTFSLSSYSVGGRYNAIPWGVGANGVTFPDSSVQTTAAVSPDLTPYATIASPTFTGDPKAPTPATSDNDTSIATTAFVKAQSYLTSSSAASTYFPIPTGLATEYLNGLGVPVTFPTVTSVGKITQLVANKTGASIAKGSVVYINGSHGSDPTVALAKADSEITSAHTIGLAESAIPDNGTGIIVTTGLLEGLATNTFTAGDDLYLSATTAGAYTNNKASVLAPNHYVKLGTVIRSHPTLGSVRVMIENGFQLDELSDVLHTSLANNDVMVYESSSQLWKNTSVTTAIGYAPANQTLGNLTNATTARTNLGLGTSATQPSTAFLQTANNLSDVTASTARTNLGLTTTATSSYSTTAEAQAGVSTTTVVNPATLLDALFNATVYKVPHTIWGTATSGTGGLNDVLWDMRRLQGPNSAANTYVRQEVQSRMIRGRLYSSNIDWAKYNAFGFRIAQAAGTDVNSIFRAILGEVTGVNSGDPTIRSIGIKYNASGALKLLAHDGTNLTTITTSYSIAGNTAVDILITSDGLGTVNLYANNILIGTTNLGPKTFVTGFNNQNLLNYRVENNNTPSGSQLSIYIAGTTIYAGN